MIGALKSRFSSLESVTKFLVLVIASTGALVLILSYSLGQRLPAAGVMLFVLLSAVVAAFTHVAYRISTSLAWLLASIYLAIVAVSLGAGYLGWPTRSAILVAPFLDSVQRIRPVSDVSQRVTADLLMKKIDAGIRRAGSLRAHMGRLLPQCTGARSSIIAPQGQYRVSKGKDLWCIKAKQLLETEFGKNWRCRVRWRTDA